MRKKLGKLEEERDRFEGIFVRYGRKAGFKGRTQETILLRSIRQLSDGVLVTDHLWLNMTKEFAIFSFNSGDKVEFDARVKKYIKGYVNKAANIDQRRADFKLSHPTKVKKISSDSGNLRQ